MKFLHIADLHLGKSMYGVSMIDSGDQVEWVNRFLAMAGETAPDAVVIAGDVYDRSNPTGDAMELLDHLLTELNAMEIPVLLVAGNHDSGQRISFAGGLLKRNGIYVSGVLNQELTHVTLPEKDGSGEVTFWLMPYVFPALVSEKLEEAEIRDYNSAVSALLQKQKIDFSKRNVLIAHQNVVSDGKEAERGGSESMVGGVGQVDYHAFDGFDYVALGHIHSAYSVGRESVRYAGTPLCYHFDELRQPAKGPLLVTVGEKGGKYARITTELKEIPPLHPLREIKKTYDEIREEEEKKGSRGEYLRIVLTDRKVTPEIADYFRVLFEAKGSKVLEITSEYEEQMQGELLKHSVKEVSNMSLTQLFRDFYISRKNCDLTDREEKALSHARDMAERAAASVHKDGTTSSMGEEAAELLEFVKSECKGGLV